MFFNFVGTFKQIISNSIILAENSRPGKNILELLLVAPKITN